MSNSHKFPIHLHVQMFIFFEKETLVQIFLCRIVLITSRTLINMSMP